MNVKKFFTLCLLATSSEANSSASLPIDDWVNTRTYPSGGLKACGKWLFSFMSCSATAYEYVIHVIIAQVVCETQKDSRNSLASGCASQTPIIRFVQQLVTVITSPRECTMMRNNSPETCNAYQTSIWRKLRLIPWLIKAEPLTILGSQIVTMINWKASGKVVIGHLTGFHTIAFNGFLYVTESGTITCHIILGFQVQAYLLVLIGL